MTTRRRERSTGIDANGCPTDTITVDGQKVVVHYDDIPESDITVIHGLRVTTPLRTVIDLASELSSSDLTRVIRDCLDRRLFTVDQALARISEADMSARPGARVLRDFLPAR